MSESELRLVFATRIMEYRIKNGWSQAELAREMGTTSGFVCDYENGHCNPILKIIDRFAKAFGVSPEELLTPLPDNYDEFGIGRVEAVELDPNAEQEPSGGIASLFQHLEAVELDPNAEQEQLEAAIAPVADRLLKQFAAAKADFKAAEAEQNEAAAQNGDIVSLVELILQAEVEQNEAAAQTAKDKMNAIVLFRADVATYQRVYTFLSQIFDCGNTDFEKRSIFFKYLLRLLKFGREREGVDLSEAVLTHHSLRNKGKQSMTAKDDQYPELEHQKILPGILSGGMTAKDDQYPELEPLGEAGSGEVRDARKATRRQTVKAKYAGHKATYCTICGRPHEPGTPHRYYGSLPYGMRKKGGRVVPDVSEQSTIKLIRKLREEEGKSLKAIAALVNRSCSNRAGGKWHHWQIKRILVREGVTVANGKPGRPKKA